MEELSDLWVAAALTWYTPALFGIGLAIGLLNVRFEFVDRDAFFERAIHWYTRAAGLVAVPIVAGLLFGPDGMFLGALAVFPFIPLFWLFHPSLLSLFLGLFVATVVRDIYFEAE
jgi:hypothetical protein